MTSPNASNILFIIPIKSYFYYSNVNHFFSNIQTAAYSENIDNPSEDIFSDVMPHSDYRGPLNDEIFPHFDKNTQETDDM